MGDILRGTLRDVRHYFVKEIPCYLPFKALIRDQQQTAVAQTEALLRQLEEHMEQLERRHADLEELAHTDDITTFIQVGNISFLYLFHSIISYYTSLYYAT